MAKLNSVSRAKFISALEHSVNCMLGQVTVFWDTPKNNKIFLGPFKYYDGVLRQLSSLSIARSAAKWVVKSPVFYLE